MQYIPDNGFTGTALLGVGDPGNYIPDKQLYDWGGIRGGSKYKSIKLVMISAVIFVAVVAIYDVLRNFVYYYWTQRSLEDPQSHYSTEEIIRTEIANKHKLTGSAVFAGICILIAIVIVLTFT